LRQTLGRGADLYLTENIDVLVDQAFFHSIRDAIERFDLRAIGRRW